MTGVSGTIRVNPTDSMLPGSSVPNNRIATTLSKVSGELELIHTTATNPLRQAIRGFPAGANAVKSVSFSLTKNVLPIGAPVASRIRPRITGTSPKVPLASETTATTFPAGSMAASTPPAPARFQSSKTPLE
jgi:hypothetical protein